MNKSSVVLMVTVLLAACTGQSNTSSSVVVSSVASSALPISSAPMSSAEPVSSVPVVSSAPIASSVMASVVKSSSSKAASVAVSSSLALSSSSKFSSSSKSLASSSLSSSSKSLASSSQSMQSSSASSTIANCSNAINRGQNLWAQNCMACHGNWPSDGRDVFVNASKGRTIDLFHSTRDYYNNKQKQAITTNISLPEFIQTYMLASANVAEAKDIAAYLTANTRGAWCPNQSWPPELTATTSSQSSSSQASSIGAKTRLKHVVFAYGAVGSDPAGAGGWGHHDPTGEGIKFLVNESGWPEEEGFKASLISLQDSPNAFVNILKQAKSGAVPPIDAIVFQGAFGKVLWSGTNSNTEAVKLFQEYIDNAGGYAGFHTIVYLDKENQWNYWWQNIMLGKCCVKGHPTKQPNKIVVEYPNHPINKALSKKEYSLNQLPAGQAQFYGFAGNLRSDKVGDVNYNPYYKVILSSPYDAGVKTSQGAALTPNDRFPYAWAYDFYPEGRGRTFTTILGNKQVFMSNSEWREFIKASIRWVAGVEQKPN